MIVKNEAHVLRELLEQVAPLINYWVIVDTGSTDGTQELVRNFFASKGLKGELHERPWKDFGWNRTEAFQLADGKADYLWVIDADDKIEGSLRFGALTHDSYELLYGKEFSYWRQQVFKSGLDWKYIGVLHEYPHSNRAKTVGRITGNYYIDSRRLGFRNRDPKKYLNDAAILERALTNEPNNARYWFYLGQSYWDAKVPDKAKAAYAQRVLLGGWAEEVYYSRFRVAQCEVVLNKPEEVVLHAFMMAYESRPTRAEPLYELARYYRERKRYPLAYHFAKAAVGIPLPKEDVLFVSRDVYEYRALDELATSAYYTPFWKEGFEAAKRLLKIPVPSSEIPRLRENLRFYEDKARA